MLKADRRSENREVGLQEEAEEEEGHLVMWKESKKRKRPTADDAVLPEFRQWAAQAHEAGTVAVAPQNNAIMASLMQEVRECPEAAMQSRVDNPNKNFSLCRKFLEGKCKLNKSCHYAHSEVCAELCVCVPRHRRASRNKGSSDTPFVGDVRMRSKRGRLKPATSSHRPNSKVLPGPNSRSSRNRNKNRTVRRLGAWTGL